MMLHHMMYKRLLLAKNLLKSDGVLVLAIDDNEVHTISLILKEIFSEGAEITVNLFGTFRPTHLVNAFSVGVLPIGTKNRPL